MVLWLAAFAPYKPPVPSTTKFPSDVERFRRETFSEWVAGVGSRPRATRLQAGRDVRNVFQVS